MNELLAFLQERWFIVAAALIALVLVIKIVKNVVKWVIVIAIAAALLYYGNTYIGEFKEVGGQIVSDVKSKITEEALKALTGDEVTYEKKENGTFTISGHGVSLEGKEGSDEVKITYLGQSVTIKADGAVAALIEQIRKSN